MSSYRRSRAATGTRDAEETGRSLPEEAPPPLYRCFGLGVPASGAQAASASVQGSILAVLKGPAMWGARERPGLATSKARARPVLCYC